MLSKTEHATSWRAIVLTLFPELFPGPLGASVIGRSLNTRWFLDTVNLRSYATDNYGSVDDSPFGGGAGMVMRPDILGRALDDTLGQLYSSSGDANPHQRAITNFSTIFSANSLDKSPAPRYKMVYLSARGRPVDYEILQDLVSAPGILLLCGRYEGVDQRVVDEYDLLELSIGNFVVSGGEVLAMALIDACVRLLPGVLGDENSLKEESHSNGLIEYPHYTRPQVWRNRAVPEVLLSGHHQQIMEWRQKQSELTTQKRRPDLWQTYCHKQKNHKQ